MDKRESNAIIFLLCIVIGILFVVLFFALLEGGKLKGQLNNSRRENDKAALALRDSREKMEKLLKAMHRIEKGEE